MERKRFTRRQIITGSAAGLGVSAAAYTLSKLESAFSFFTPKAQGEQETINPAIAIFDSTFGLHGVATPGGAIDYKKYERHYKELEIKTAFEIDPSSEIIKILKALGIKIYARALQENNVFNAKNIESTVGKLIEQGVKPIVATVNEPNNPEENGNKEFSPKEIIDEVFVPGAKLITQKNGIVLFPPLAEDPNDKDNIKEMEYLRKMLYALKEHDFPAAWFREHFAVAAHMYHLTPEYNSWPRIKKIYEVIKEELKLEPLVIISEAGVYNYGAQIHDEETVADVTLKFLQSSIPEEFADVIKSICFWIYANIEQRPKEHANDPRAKKIEPAAWLKKEGKTLVFQKVEHFARERKANEVFNLAKA
ncbi:hypothetical protein C4559_03835 [Candidatus Microgenomates bacterium]|nr:MAG: hypothetical protein C4559_03835 [Candidatus Microgenomates bacterium]